MEKKSLIPLLVLSLGLVSCADLSHTGMLIRGNYFHERGEYQQALLEYLEVLENGAFRGVTRYNIGNVYFALGEDEAARREWGLALEDAEPELRAQAWFNIGYSYHILGDFERSFEAFKETLRHSPGHREGRINLELTLIKLQALRAAGGASRDRPGESSPLGRRERDEAEAVLEYIRRTEVNRWTSNRTNPPMEDPRDW